MIIALLSCLLAPILPAGDWKLAIISLPSAPFPHESRREGYTAGDKTNFPADKHYSDSSVGIVIPDNFTAGDATSFIVHFHGHRNNVANVLTQFGLQEQLNRSGVNAVLVIPQGPLDAPDSGCGKLEDAGGLENLLKDVATSLKDAGKTKTDKIGSVILTAHSGGYKATAACVKHGGLADHITDVLLFDATYGGLDQFAAFAAGGANRRIVSIFTEHLASENYMLLVMLNKLSAPYSLLMEDDWKDEELLPRRTIFMHTRKLAHNDVVSKVDYFSRFLKTSSLK